MILNLEELDYGKYKGNSRALCIDYGDERIGISISDINWIIASPLKVLKSHGVFSCIFDIIKEHNIGLVVVGLPVSLSGGTQGKQLEKVKKFTDKLVELLKAKELDVDVLYWDERLSTSAAGRILNESNISMAKCKKHIDKVASSFILQGLLDYLMFNND